MIIWKVDIYESLYVNKNCKVITFYVKLDGKENYKGEWTV